ncbi:MAG: ArsR/SmtB family transcription factor [Hyphomicrobiaceae bacterium]
MGVTYDPQLSVVFRSLADDTRRQILDEQRVRDEQSLFELCARLIENHSISLTRQGITRHLNTLEEAGLIEISWKGRTKFHSLSASDLEHKVKPWLRPFWSGESS